VSHDNVSAEAALLRRLEEELLKPEVRRSPGQVGVLLSDDFVEFGSSGGVFNKQQVIEALEQEGPADPSIIGGTSRDAWHQTSCDLSDHPGRRSELGKSPDYEAQSGN
jgi:hypothetical protein